MRQFVVGLLVLLLGWWGCSRWGGTPAAAGGETGANQTTNGSAATGQADLDLTKMLGAPPERTAVPPTPAPPPLDARTPPASVAPAPDVDSLVTHLAQRDVTARAEAWHLLASPRLGAARQRLVDALAPASGDDFGAMLASLGSDNGFLHSAEGRAAADKVLAVALRLPDAEAVLAASQLIGLCLRGRIEKGDTEVRAFVDRAYQQHLVRVDRWVCDPGNVARARSYTIGKGDSLAAVAKRFRGEGVMVEDGTLAVLNRIHNPNAISVGQKIKVPIDPIVAVLEKRSFALAVYVGEYLLRLYWVGHGEQDKTPVTEFVVAEKQPRPDWTAPNGKTYPYGDPNNILGEYFIKFRHDRYTGFGAHGTPMPETIGTMSSAGCIRMLAADIAELFKLLPRGAKVLIRCTESIH